MKKFLPALLAILTIPAFAFAATKIPATATWDASTGGDLPLTVTGATDIISYEDAVKIGTAPLYFTFSGGKGSFGKEDYKYDAGTLTIYETALKKMGNATYSLVVTTTDTATDAVTVADADITIDLTTKGFTGVGAVVLKSGSTTVILDPSEFSFASGVLTIAKGKVTSGDYTATIYEGLPVTLTVSGNTDTTGSDTNATSNSSSNASLTTTSATTTSSANNSSGSSSGGGGCNAGFGALALIMALPMFYRRKK